MKEKLTVENLMASYYDNGFHELEFDVDGKTVFVRNIKIEDDVDLDEFYWDEAENVDKAVAEADDEDIEVK